jgi:activator of HSP90 ATPase
MPKTFTQKIIFRNTSPSVLFELYLNAKKHALVTAAPAVISTREGTNFSLQAGHITGKNLQLIKNKLIVQSWRASDWKAEDIDSTVIMHFKPKGKDVILYFVQGNVPNKYVNSINKAWKKSYWKPWKKHLSAEPEMQTNEKKEKELTQ